MNNDQKKVILDVNKSVKKLSDGIRQALARLTKLASKKDYDGADDSLRLKMLTTQLEPLHQKIDAIGRPGTEAPPAPTAAVVTPQASGVQPADTTKKG